MSQTEHFQQQASENWSNDGLDRGVVDLYARRMEMAAAQRADERQAAIDRIVVTRPFGRAFTAQPSFPPDPTEPRSGFAGLRKKLSGATPGPRRKLATS